MFCCPSSVMGCAIRFTRLNECGVPLDPLTPNSRMQGTFFTSLQLSPDLESGADITVMNACGDICIRHRDCDRLKGFNVTLTLCGQPTPALEMFLGVSLLEAPATPGTYRGWVLPDSKTAGCTDDLSVEVWAQNADPSNCNIAGTTSEVYVDWLLPKLSNLQLSGDITFTNDAVVVELSGYAENNTNWFPSYPGALFPSWVPGGGDPTGVPTGAPPPVLPPDVTADPWSLADATAIRAGGPLASICVGELPSPLNNCDYVPVEDPEEE